MKHAILFAASVMALAANGARADTVTQAMPFSLSHGVMMNSLLAHEILVEGRMLVHLSHTCNVVVDGVSLPIVDVRELIKGATTPRGVARLVVLDPALNPLHVIEYGSARPLFCDGDKLFLYGDVAVDVVTPEGNVLVLSEGGTVIATEMIDANDLPAPKVEAGRLVD